MHPIVTAMFGATAGAASVFGNTPLDVVKTRMQVGNTHSDDYYYCYHTCLFFFFFLHLLFSFRVWKPTATKTQWIVPSRSWSTKDHRRKELWSWYSLSTILVSLMQTNPVYSLTPYCFFLSCLQILQRDSSQAWPCVLGRGHSLCHLWGGGQTTQQCVEDPVDCPDSDRGKHRLVPHATYNWTPLFKVILALVIVLTRWNFILTSFKSVT